MTSAPSPRVVAREAVGRRRRRVRLTLDDDTTLEVNPTVLETHPVAIGDPVDPRLRARLLDADARWRCRDAALSLLSVRVRSRKELRDRLRRKEYPARIVSVVLDGLEEEGWLDDAAFARALVRDRVRFKHRAPIRLEQELRRKGVARDIAAEAVRQVFDEEEISPRELAVEAALGWLRRQGAETAALLAGDDWSEDLQREKRRLVGYLARRGFRGSAAVAAVDAAREAASRRRRDG